MDSTSLYLCLDHAEYDDDGYIGKKISSNGSYKKIHQWYWRVSVVKKK